MKDRTNPEEDASCRTNAGETVSDSFADVFPRLAEAADYARAIQAEVDAGFRLPDSFVYFIREDISGGRIKIGFAKDPMKRLRTLQTGSARKLRLIAVIPGDEALERILHAEFAERRGEGEWFRTSFALRARIRAAAKEHRYWLEWLHHPPGPKAVARLRAMALKQRARPARRSARL